MRMNTRTQADDLTTTYNRKEHRHRTGRFLEDNLPVQAWVTLKSPKSMTEIEWDNAFDRWITEVQRLVGFTVGYHRGDETRPGRHLHVALVSYRPVPLRNVKHAWVTVMGPGYKKYVWAERYRPRGGGLSYEMKADGQPGCVWRFSDNIDLLTRSGDGTLHRTSSARERRNARRVQAQRQDPGAIDRVSTPRSMRGGSRQGTTGTRLMQTVSGSGYPAAGMRGLKNVAVGTTPLPPSRSSDQTALIAAA